MKKGTGENREEAKQAKMGNSAKEDSRRNKKNVQDSRSAQNPEGKQGTGDAQEFFSQLSIGKYLHAQFIKIGFVVGAFLFALGVFAIYEGTLLAREYAGRYDNMSAERQITLTVLLISGAVLAGILLVDFLLFRVAKKAIRRIHKPVDIMDDAMGRLASGDLEDSLAYGINDEFANMMANTKKAMQELKKYIGNISETLHQMSEKNMDISIEDEYVGEFAEIRSSLLSIIDSLNATMLEMRSSFTQVRDGAGSMAQTAQSMADGAEQQSKHIRGLREQIEKTSALIHDNTVAAENMEQLSLSSMDQMEKGEEKMQELTAAMDSIREASNEIASIIEMIRAIASQTNLLSLNASIEAARAGEHGRGFAVVAGEIGTLAGSSAEASQKITALIQKSIAAVNHGVDVTSETAVMLEGISVINAEISQSIAAIADASRTQDAYLKEMVDSSNEIAAVTDENTAAAEESSAISQELLSYTENVMAMIEAYRIRKN